MASFRITLVDQTTEIVPGADAYQQEGPLTTFFVLAPGRSTIDSWSSRLASFRTSDITAIRRDDTAIRRDDTAIRRDETAIRRDDTAEPAPLLRSA